MTAASLGPGWGGPDSRAQVHTPKQRARKNGQAHAHPPEPVQFPHPNPTFTRGDVRVDTLELS